MLPKRLNLAILAQALEDYLKAECKKPLTGDAVPTDVEEALLLIARYPSLVKKISMCPPEQKLLWLKKIEGVLNEKT